MLIEELITAPSILSKTLADEGYHVLERVNYQEDLYSRVKSIDPDMIIVNVESPDEEMLSQLQHINNAHPKPIVIFSEKGDSRIIDAAVEAGVSAFIVDGLVAKRIRPVLDVALARFKNYCSLRNELEKTRENLANRKIIEKAKGLIMKQRHCTEDEAYTLLRKLAMDRNQKLIDVAKSVMEVSSLLM